MSPGRRGQNSDIKVKLNRDLGLFDITMIGIAGMIGAGVFALTGIAAGVAGPALILVFLFNGAIGIITAASYAELGSALPGAGGGYVWIKETFPSSFGFLAGWIDWFAHSVACSLYAVTFGVFVAAILFPAIPLSRSLLAKVSSFIAISFLAYINYRGVKETGRIGGFVTVLKVLILVVFVGFGIYKTLNRPDWIMQFTNPSFTPTGLIGILAAMGLTFIAFEGFEIIVQSGEEVKNPAKNIPRAIFISLFVAVVIYILVAFTVLGAIKTPNGIPSWVFLGRLAEMGLINVSKQIMPYGTLVLLIAGLISTISAMNATIYSSSRISFALARDGYLSSKLAHINKKTKTPHVAVFFTYIIITTIALLLPIEAVAASADIMFIILFIQVNLVLIILRFRSPNLKRTFRVPLVPYLPLIAISLQIIIAFFMITRIANGYIAFATSIAWIFLGVIIYFTYSRKKERNKLEKEFKTVFKEKAVRKVAYRILVPIGNPATAKKLIDFANLIARSREGEIVLLSVLTLPQQTPLYAGKKYVQERKDFLRKFINEAGDIPTSGILKVSHSTPEAILNTIEEEKINQVILGWRGRTFRRDFILGSTIDPIILKAPCDVIAVRFESGFEAKNIKKILIPTAGGPHGYMAAEIAKDLQKVTKAEAALIYVAGDEKSMKLGKAYVNDTRRAVGIEADSIVKLSDDRIGTIAKEIKRHDIVVIGATHETFLKNFIKGVFPEIVSRKTEKTVVMVRRKLKIKDIFWRWPF